MESRPFGLKPDEYWTNPRKGMSEFAWEKMLSGFEGLLIDCPEFVSLDSHTDLPLILLSALDHEKIWESPDWNASLTAMDMETGRFFWGRPIMRPDWINPNARKPAPGISVDDIVVDARSTLQLPEIPGTYLISAIHTDVVSNRLVTHFSEKKGDYGTETEKAILKKI